MDGIFCYDLRAPVTGLVAEAGADQTLFTDTEAIIHLDASLSQSDGESPITNWRWQVDGEEVATGRSAAIPRPAGTYTITLEVSDSAGASAIDTTSITIRPPLVAPTITTPITVAPKAPRHGELVSLSAVATDADADDNQLVYRWEIVSGPGTATFFSNEKTTSATTDAAFAEPGTYVIRVTAIDADGGEATSQSEVTIAEQAYSGAYRYLRIEFIKSEGLNATVREITWMDGDQPLPVASMMTSNSPAPQRVSATRNGGGAWQAFDRDPESGWNGWNRSESITLDLGPGESAVPTAVSLLMNAQAARLPQAVLALGSHDGLTYVPLFDSRTDATGPYDWNAPVRFSFPSQ